MCKKQNGNGMLLTSPGGERVSQGRSSVFSGGLTVEAGFASDASLLVVQIIALQRILKL